MGITEINFTCDKDQDHDPEKMVLKISLSLGSLIVVVESLMKSAVVDSLSLSTTYLYHPLAFYDDFLIVSTHSSLLSSLF